jgi:cell division protein FtsB
MDDLFEIEGDGATTSTSIQGSNNNVNSTVINQDVSSLQAENYALKKLIEEKDDRIKQLQENLKMVIEFANKKILTEKKDEEEKPK